jgi:glycosyltransferase involved in cell wall biosynthesis
MKLLKTLKILVKNALLKTGLFRIFSIPPPYKIVEFSSDRDKRRTRILHCIGVMEIGGSQRLVIDLIENLSDRYEQRIVTSVIKYPLAYVGVKITEARNISKIKSCIDIFKPEIIHVHYWPQDWYRNIFRIAEDLGIPVVENVNMPTGPFLSPAVNSYVYVSSTIKNECTQKLDDACVIYPGSNFQLFQNRAIDTSPDNCIGMVYRLVEGKINANSIDVFIKVVERKRDVNCLIVGGGPLRNIYKSKVKQAGLLGNFVFTGNVQYEKLPSLYNKMSIFVAPVISESFGQVTPIAMNVGMPVCGYNTGALKEIINDSNLLASPGNSDELASIIVDLLNDKPRRHQISKFNQDRATKTFSVNVMIENYRRLYSKIELNNRINCRSSDGQLKKPILSEP